jgi:phage gp16-like protein
VIQASTEDVKKREVRLIKIAQRELKMDDDTYRAILFSIARVQSATDLDAAGRRKMLAHLKACGFKVKSAPASRNASDGRYRKIRVLWKQLKGCGLVDNDTDQAVRAYILRTTGCEDFQFLNDHQVGTVIESLKKWLTRADQQSEKGSVHV